MFDAGYAPKREPPKPGLLAKVRGGQRLLLDHVPGEPDGEWAAKEFLLQVRGWREAQRETVCSYMALLAPLLAAAGGRDAYAGWIAYLADDSYLRDRGNFAKNVDNVIRLRFEAWCNAGRPSRPPAPKSYKPPDPDRVNNANEGVPTFGVCYGCRHAEGNRHHETCVLVKAGLAQPGSRIEPRQCKGSQMRPLLEAALEERRKRADAG